MTSEAKLKEIIIEAMNSVKAVEAGYENLVVNGDTIILGLGGAFDSIAFSAFAVALEEKIEDSFGVSFITDVEKIFKLNPGASQITVDKLAACLSGILSQTD